MMDLVVIIIFVGIIVSLIVGLLQIDRALYRLRQLRKAQQWEGTIADKYKTKTEQGHFNLCYITVKFDNGPNKQVQVPAKLWKNLAIGDRVVKPAGKNAPRKAD
jgi:hypothetical protein